MNLEDRLRSRLADGLDGVDPGRGDRVAAERLGRRFRLRRRLGQGVAALTVVALVAVGVALPWLGGGRDVSPAPAPPPKAGGTWTDLPAAPIDGRWGAVGAWTGTEAVFVGGGTAQPCPPNADCADPEVLVRDGAAYDPAVGAWRRIAAAPVPVGYWFRATAVDGDVVLYGDDGQGGERWLAYDPEADAWETLPPPPRQVLDWGEIPSYDGDVYAISDLGTVLVLDLADRSWSELPPSPGEPRLDLTSVLPTDRGVFVSGVVSGASDAEAYTHVERWDGGAWTRLPVTGQVGPFVHAGDDHLLNTDPQVAGGAAGEPPFGGRLDLRTLVWSQIPGNPDPETTGSGGWSVLAAGGNHVVSWGYDFDDRTGTFTPIGEPDSDVDDGQAAVWAGDRLIVFGGIDEATAYEDTHGGPVQGLSRDAWAWTP